MTLLKRFGSMLMLGACGVTLGMRADTTNSQPTEWIDPATGHRIIQLSREPGSESLYFNLNPFTPDGQKMVFESPTGISTINLQTRAIEKIVEGRVRIIMVGRQTGQVYYYRLGTNSYLPQNRIVYATDLNTKVTREAARLPRGAMVSAINADETLMAGTITDPGAGGTNQMFGFNPNLTPDQQRQRKGRMIQERFNRRLTMELFFLNVKTGRIKTCDRGHDWLNHLQFSPTDPHVLLFCHEGPWHKVDRIWTIRTDGTHLTLVHQRAMAMEIAGHEFWSADGKTVWYDVQTPRGEDFWVAGYNVDTGARTWYHLQRNEWGVHFNVSPDGKLFSSDGGDENMVAHALDGRWLYLFHPELLSDQSGPEINSRNLIKPGVFHSEKLVNMAKHDYALEQNAMFSPDMKWLIFRSNMSGASQVYAVELKRAEAKAGSQSNATTGL